MVSKKQRNLILLLLFIGWAIGNFDRYFINYAILSITEDLQLSPAVLDLSLVVFLRDMRSCKYQVVGWQINLVLGES